ncbi:MAG: hypothetical protein IPO07_30770 [Haliscomenobacter sp.]|nr:hypothetical protein [Haliscomenobacter sp.]MBK9492668.1 hypothetical protein [Haliscomenobacter sp.]
MMALTMVLAILHPHSGTLRTTNPTPALLKLLYEQLDSLSINVVYNARFGKVVRSGASWFHGEVLAHGTNEATTFG